jgi:hypothetical protein
MGADMSLPGWGGGRAAILPWMKFVALRLAKQRRSSHVRTINIGVMRLEGGKPKERWVEMDGAPFAPLVMLNLYRGYSLRCEHINMYMKELMF